LPAVEDQDELVDRLGVPEVRWKRQREVGEPFGRTSPVQVLVVVGEQEQVSILGLSMQREELRPPGREEVLALVDNHGVVARSEDLRAFLEEIREHPLEVIAGCGLLRWLLRQGKACLLGHLAAQLVKVKNPSM